MAQICERCEQLGELSPDEEELRYDDRITGSELFDRVVLASNKICGFLLRNLANIFIQTERTKEERRLFHNNNEQSLRGKLEIPKLKSSFRLANHILALLIVAHHIFVLWLISDFNEARLCVSASEPTLHVTSQIAHLQGPIFTMPDAGCYALERWFEQRYGRLVVWRAHKKVQSGVAAIDEALFLGQTDALQAWEQEERAFMIILMFFIAACSTIAHILGEIVSYDMIPALLVFDPHYVASKTRQQVLGYVQQIQESFNNVDRVFINHSAQVQAHKISRNFNSLVVHCSQQLNERQTNALNDLAQINQSCTTRRRRLANQCYAHLRSINYLPTIRTQIARKFVLLYAPLYVLALCAITTCLISVVFVLSIDVNRGASVRNTELKQFLQGSAQNLPGLQQVLSGPCGNFSINGTRKSLGEFVSRGLEAINDSLFKLQGAEASAFIAPTKVPNIADWTTAIVMNFMMGAITSLLFLSFMSILLELCYWLLEINLKLNVCSSIFHKKLEQKSSFYERGHEEQARTMPQLFHCARDTQTFANIKPAQVLKFIAFSNMREREAFCQNQAQHLLHFDHLELARDCKQCAWVPRTSLFLHTTYIDFRLFADQIDRYRSIINFHIAFSLIQGVNIVAASRLVDSISFKIVYIAIGTGIINYVLGTAAFFQSQCVKLMRPIYQMLSCEGTQTEPTLEHLLNLWKRQLEDCTGSRSRFSFRAYSFSISYALLLQLNLGIASIYIITLDRHY